MSDEGWYSVWGPKLSDEKAAEMELRKEYFLSLPKEEWNTGKELPDHPIAVLTSDGHVCFMDTFDKRTQKTTDFRGVFNLISFAWGRQSVGWLPLGE